MTTKEKLLELLESNKGVYFSGEEIAQKLCVSRTAIWKAMKALRTDGYSIDAVTNKGYRLSVSTDILSPQGIRKYLPPKYQDLQISVLPTADSTNTLMRKEAHKGLPEGCTVIANQQTSGRGRCGREFYSPGGTGIYLSMLLRPSACSPQQAVQITTKAAVAMCEAIETVCGLQAQIKWVNDIFVGGKKVCGILTEGSFSMESGLLEYAVLGVGLNLYTPPGGFPQELEHIAGSLFEFPQDDMKNRLTADFINRFMDDYTAQNQTDYVKKYRNRSFVIGKKVSVLCGNQSRNALVCGIDDECRLQVKYDSGETASLSYGEIRIGSTPSDTDIP